MEQQYWFITYSWINYENKRVISQTVHHGSMSSWIDDALDQSEYWVLMNQCPIDKDHYLALKERV